MPLDLQLLQQLCETPGVPGREERVRNLIMDSLQGVVNILEVDPMGNLIVIKRAAKEGAKRVMLSAHMDEIGFYVKFIDDKGFLRVHNVGGFDTRNLFARQVRVQASGGDDLYGVMHPATKPIHIATPEERKKIPEMAEFAIDLGLPADTVKEKVKIGDPVTLVQTFRELGDTVTCKALDDRVNCYILIEVLKRLENPRFDVCAVFSVQEEVGLRGAITAAYKLEPQIGIALDTTLAVDTPGAAADQSITRLGEGVALKVMDSSTISTRWLLDEFKTLAEERGIKHQLEILPLGGTDAGAIQRSRAGVPSLTLSIPSRYVHTVIETVATGDVEAALELLLAYLES